MAGKLSLTHFRQEDESGGCLPACAQMVLAHLAIFCSQTDLGRARLYLRRRHYAVTAIPVMEFVVTTLVVFAA